MDYRCRIFGHRFDTVYHRPDLYQLKISKPNIDGIGRHHFQIYKRCGVCLKTFQVGVVVTSSDFVIDLYNDISPDS